MADPLSIASGVAGIVSLGLTLCNGLHTYLSAIKDRGEDAESTWQLLALLRSNIDLIGSSTSTLSTRYARATQGVRLGLKLSESQLKALETIVQDLGDVDGPSSVASKWQKQKAIVLYPFNRNKLMQVQDQLLKATGVLGTFVQNLILNVNIGMGEDLDAFKSAVNQSSLVTHDFLAQIKEQTAATFDNHAHQNEVNCRVLERLDVITSGIEEMRVSSISHHYRHIEPASSPRYASNAMEQTHNRDLATPRCTCRFRGRISYRRRTNHSWGGVAISKTELQDSHQLGCALYTTYSSTKSTKTTITYTGLRNFFFKILDISFEQDCRGGSHTISYGLRTCNVREDNPTFDIIDLVNSDYYYREDLFDPVHEAKKAKEKLKILYSSHSASPFDVDGDGENIAHKCVETFRDAVETWMDSKLRNELLQAMRIVLSYLCDIGVRVNEADHFNRTPFHLAMESCDPRFIPLVYDAFEEYDPQFDPSRNFTDSNVNRFLYPPFKLEYQTQWIDIFSERLDITQGIGYEGLFLAVIQKNEQRLQAILDTGRFPNYVSERDSFGRHVLHFCSGWAAGLELLLRVEAVRELLNVKDTLGRAPLDYSLMYTGNICKSLDNWTECQDCGCCEALQMFLQMDCKLVVDESWPGTLKLCSMKARKLLLKSLKDRRDRLLNIARMHLPETELPDSVMFGRKTLDVDIKPLWEKLKEKGIKPSEGLSEYSIYSGHPKGFFFYVHCPRVAEMALNFSFQDTDVPDNRGITPILELAASFGNEDDILMYADWLLQKGANIKHSTNSGQVSAAHCLAFIYGQWLDMQRRQNKDRKCLRPKHVRVFSEVCSSKAMSHLSCPCMTDELSQPLNYFLLGSMDWSCARRGHRYIGPYSDIVRRATTTVDFLDHAVSGLDGTYLAKSVIHLVTLQALGIGHLPGCHRDAYRWSEKELQDPERQDEWNEILEEDRPLIEKLGELDEEFEQEFQRQTVSIADFLQNCWLPRMRQVRKQQKEPLTEDQKQSLREAGVILGEPEESTSDCNGSEYDDESEHEEEEDDDNDYEKRGDAGKDMLSICISPSIDRALTESSSHTVAEGW
ncbi:hypothetical protein FALBO_4088 [Fusarium albosuccineum]|uniref:Fungal N-terminal domain-containing protein n=1 Tax=Fusarium albosuccineum TaxID=1237068 RepID=A0A8H4PKX9_9HYPO|nr:hypothetical protein FALBO_4088 [Fusarium albosuccineum]